MKRAASEELGVRKRRCPGSSHSSAPNVDRGRKRRQPASLSSLPPLSHCSTLPGLTQARDPQPEAVHSTTECADNHSNRDCFDTSDDEGIEVQAIRASPPPSKPSSQLPALTEEALGLLQRSLITHKLESCFADHNLEVMAAPPTPRSAASHSRVRTRRPPRSYGSRTPSPSKKPTPQTYRTRNMYHSNVMVEHLDELPPTVDNEVRRILNIDSWEDQVVTPGDRQLLHDAATLYRAESVQNTRDCALEGEWKASLFQLIKQLLNPAAGKLKAHMSEKIWNSALKPTGPPLYDINDEDDCGMRTTFDTEDTVETIWSAPSLPPSTVGTSNSEAADPYYISTPKPDITIGLAHTGLERHHQWCLVDYQASGIILSDPYAADMGMRFPFLIVEVKGLSQNGSLVGAQNQAAISGACMLTILQDLQNPANRSATSTLDVRLASLERPSLCFSIVTAGAIHEMYVHFMQGGTIHMHCIQSFRTTFDRESRVFVYYLSQILEWGSGVFRSSVSEKLNLVPRRGIAEIPPSQPV